LGLLDNPRLGLLDNPRLGLLDNPRLAGGQTAKLGDMKNPPIFFKREEKRT